MHFLEDVSLSDFTSFGIGGRARYFARVFSVEDLKEAFNFVLRNELPIFVLGRGTNVLASDKGFNGFVIKNEISGIEVEGFGEDRVWLIAGAGENWDDVVDFAVANNLAGLEPLSGIPGTVGAGAVQNIGAYGVEISDTLEWVEVFDPRLFLAYRISKEDCNLGYRHSIFKEMTDRNLVVTRVCFKLCDSEFCLTELSHPKLREYFNDPRDLKLADLREAVLDARSRNLPLLYNLGTAGSFFKNPRISSELLEKLLDFYSDAPYTDEGEGSFKIPAGWLIEKVGGFKGCCLGRAGVWKNHALILVNHGGATSSEVKTLADSITSYLKDKTSIELEWEVVYLE